MVIEIKKNKDIPVRNAPYSFIERVTLWKNHYITSMSASVKPQTGYITMTIYETVIL